MTGMHAPAHPIEQLTTTELANYRRELEQAIGATKSAMVADELRRRLAEVHDEEESRASIAAASKTEPRDLNAHYSA